MKIETNRCFLNPIHREDKEDLYQLYKNEAVRQFLGGTIDKTSYDSRFTQFVTDTDGIHWTLRLKENNEFIGVLNISKHHDGMDYEISYQSLPIFWNRGLMREALAAALEYAAKQMRLTHILAETQSGNISSIKLLEKIGMEPIRTVVRFGKEQMIFRKQLMD